MKLKLVNASWNGLDDEGALAFSDCLSNNSVLTELDISCSRIGDKGYAQVMRALKKNEDLEVLRVGRGPFLPLYRNCSVSQSGCMGFLRFMERFLNSSFLDHLKIVDTLFQDNT